MVSGLDVKIILCYVYPTTFNILENITFFEYGIFDEIELCIAECTVYMYTNKSIVLSYIVYYNIVLQYDIRVARKLSITLIL